VVGAELQVDELGQSHTFILSFHWSPPEHCFT
jgi:hypothetical protein